MKEREINFMTISSNIYFPYVNFTAKQLMKFYPSCNFFIYDWGLTPPQKRKLKSYPISRLIDWYDKIDWEFGYKKIKNIDGLPPHLKRNKDLLYLLNQKPVCMLDCAKRIKENLIYFDGDAILINPIDEIFEDNYDIGITILDEDLLNRSFEDLEILKKYMMGDINSGVIFFKSSSKYIQLFIQEWLNEIEISKRPDHFSLINLIKDRVKDIFKKSYNIRKITLSNTEFKIKAFPASIYNYFRIYDGYDDKKVKFLHFIKPPPRNKGSPATVVRDFIIEMKFRYIYFNFLKLFPLRIKNSIRRIFRYRLLLYLIKYPLEFNWIVYVFFKIISNAKKEFLKKDKKIY